MIWRNTSGAYGLVAICLHWLIALMFLTQIGLGYLTQITDDQPQLQFELYQLHKSTGFLILALALLRLGWTVSSQRPRPLPARFPIEPALARLVHLALLTLTIAVPVTGWAIASASTLEIPSYAFNLVVIPDLPLNRTEGNERLWSDIHAALAYFAAALAIAHAAAAIYHHVIRRDLRRATERP